VHSGVSTQAELLSRYERLQHSVCAGAQTECCNHARLEGSDENCNEATKCAHSSPTHHCGGGEEAGCSFSWNELSNITTDMG
jgi:hypothetical protein